MTSVTTTKSPSSGCSCSGPCSGSCSSSGTFVRPRFFAGQLLTEEDLQLLADYTVGKHRLHNRHLFGEGVVCGLDVAHHPCEPGQVILQPGLAFDCCGNDLVIGCETTLDINDMIRDLRFRLRGGYDCGDPCAGEKQRANAQQRALTASGPNPTTGIPGQKVTPEEPRPASYCLYARYCEQPADPVSPHFSGEPCGDQNCQPSRIREGFTFELGCPTTAKPEPGLFERVRACLGDLLSAETVVRDIRAYHWLGQEVRRVFLQIQENKPITFTPADRKLLNESRTFLVQFNRDTAQALESTIQPPECRLRDALDHFQAGASAVARFRKNPNQNDFNFVNLAVETLNQTAEKLRPLTRHFIPRDKLFVDELLTLASPWLHFSLENPTNGLPNRVPDQFFQRDVVFTQNVATLAAKELAQGRSWLLDRTAVDRFASDFYTNVEQIDIRPAYDPNTFTDQTDRLSRATMRYLADCICRAVNPPCPSGDDPKVLLACLDMVDCKVTHICTSKRGYVMSPRALRYWLPFFQQLGNTVETLCCTYAKDLDKQPKPCEKPPDRRYFSTMTPPCVNYRPDSSFSAGLSYAGIAQAETETFVNVTGNISGIVSDTCHGPVFDWPGFDLKTNRPPLNPADLVTVLNDTGVAVTVSDLLRPHFKIIDIEPVALVDALNDQLVQDHLTAITADRPIDSAKLISVLKQADVKAVIDQFVTAKLTPTVVANTFEDATVRAKIDGFIGKFIDDKPIAPGKIIDILKRPEVKDTLTEIINPVPFTPTDVAKSFQEPPVRNAVDLVIRDFVKANPIEVPASVILDVMRSADGRKVVQDIDIPPQVLLTALADRNVSEQIVKIAADRPIDVEAFTKLLDEQRVKDAINSVVPQVTAADVAGFLGDPAVVKVLESRFEAFASDQRATITDTTVIAALESPAGKRAIKDLIANAGPVADPAILMKDDAFVGDLAERLSPLVTASLAATVDEVDKQVQSHTRALAQKATKKGLTQQINTLTEQIEELMKQVGNLQAQLEKRQG